MLIAGAVGAWFGLHQRDLHQSDFLAATSIAILLIALGALVGLVKQPRNEMALRAKHNSEYIVLPRQLPSEQLRRIAIPLSIASVTFAAFAVRATLQAGPLTDPAKSLVITSALFIFLLAVVLVRATIRPHHSQPQLTINTDRPMLDHLFQISVEVAVQKVMHVEACLARVRCLENVLLHMGRYTQLVVRPHTEKAVVFAQDEDFSPHQTMLADAEILLPSVDNLPSGKSGWTSYPHYTWQIDIEISGSHSSVTVFPITISTEHPVQLI